MNESSGVVTERSPNLRFEGRSVETAQSGMLIIKAVLPIGPPVNPAPIHYGRSIAAAVVTVAVICSAVFYRSFVHSAPAAAPVAVLIAPSGERPANTPPHGNAVQAAPPRSTHPQTAAAKPVVHAAPAVERGGPARAHTTVAPDRKIAAVKTEPNAAPAREMSSALPPRKIVAVTPARRIVHVPAVATIQAHASAATVIAQPAPVIVANSPRRKVYSASANIPVIRPLLNSENAVRPATNADAHRVSQAITGQISSVDENAADGTACPARMHRAAGRCVPGASATEER